MKNMKDHYQAMAEIAFRKLQQNSSLHRREFIDIISNYEKEYKLESSLKTNEKGSDQIDHKILRRFNELRSGKYHYMPRNQIWVRD